MVMGIRFRLLACRSRMVRFRRGGGAPCWAGGGRIPISVRSDFPQNRRVRSDSRGESRMKLPVLPKLPSPAEERRLTRWRLARVRAVVAHRLSHCAAGARLPCTLCGGSRRRSGPSGDGEPSPAARGERGVGAQRTRKRAGNRASRHGNKLAGSRGEAKRGPVPRRSMPSLRSSHSPTFFRGVPKLARNGCRILRRQPRFSRQLYSPVQDRIHSCRHC